MVMDDLLLHIFCRIDDAIKQLHLGRLRQRGPQPLLADSEVITLEIAGELQGLEQDQALYRYFRRHYRNLFPALARVSRSTFVRQAANLWRLKQCLQQHLAQQFLATQPDEPLWVLDSFPLPVCRFARAPVCQRLAGIADFGFDHTDNVVYYGLRVHLRCADCGVITQVELASARQHDSELVAELLPVGAVGLGDRNYWDPPLQTQLRAEGKRLLAPFRRKSTDPWPTFSKLLSRLRQVIEPVIGQLAVRLHAKHTWARDLWHLCSRLFRKVLAHTVALLINAALGNPPLQLERLLND